MSVEKDKKVVTEEVDDRLDAFFSDDDWGPAPEPPPRPTPPKAAAPPDDDDVVTLEAAPSPPTDADKLGLGELKVLILSLDWEITDTMMEKMEITAKGLRERYAADAVAITHLSLMELLGKYIRVKKADAHPDSVTLLREVYEGLESCLAGPGLDETTRKRSALALVERFNRIKKQIAAVKGPRHKAAEAVAEGEIIESRVASEEDEGIITAQPVAPSAVNLAAIKDEMLAALKSHLDAELAAIRAEIREAREAVLKAVAQAVAVFTGAGPAPQPESLSGEDENGDIIDASPAEQDVLEAAPLEAAVLPEFEQGDIDIADTLPLNDDVIDAEPIEAPVAARELPGSSDLAAEGDLAMELGLSMDDDLGPDPNL